MDSVTLAVLKKARGIRGEVSCDGLGTRTDRFEGLENAVLRAPDGRERPVEIESAWDHNGRLILKFRGIDDMTSAEALEGFELRIPKSERPPAPDGEFYFSDLVGCEVVEKKDGRSLGKVKTWEEFGPTPLLVVGEKDLMVPFAGSICVEVDVAGKRIVVDLPEGLEDL